MIHERAVVDSGARLAPGVTVGAYSVIGADVEIGEGTWIGPHTVLKGPLRIGRDNAIYQFSSIGEAPQDKNYGGEPTRLEIGDRNMIREYVTLNRGSTGGVGATRIGSDNFIMAYVHVAHDCQIGNHTVFANNASLAGHVRIDDYVILGGFSLVSQYCSLGEYSFTCFGAGIDKDVPPYILVRGHVARPVSINTVGLKRHGFPPEVIRRLRQVFRVLYRSGLRSDEAKRRLQQMAADCPPVEKVIDFIAASRRGIMR